MYLLLLITLLPPALADMKSLDIPPTCDSEIYCKGNILHQVQMSSLYTDSKTFVDKSLRFDPAKVIEKFTKLKLKYKDGMLPKSILKSFVDENFIDADFLEKWTPLDWTSKPSIIKRIKDPEYQQWVLNLNDIWRTLGRKINESLKEDPEKHSLIFVPNGFIVPGGRFNELYYWDTYWIVHGLLICDMKETAKGVIENLLHLVNLLGHMPNGNRVYYEQRSQPPMLTLMVNLYYEFTQDKTFLAANIDLLDREMDYWNSARSVDVIVNGKTYKMFRYHAVSSGPRPESYREDFNLASQMNEHDKTKTYVELKSGAESGWDFSSRWFKTEEIANANLSDIRTSTIVPVDLNAILHKCFNTISSFYDILDNNVKSKQYKDLANQLQNAIQNVFWDPEDGIWYDYDLKNKKRRKYFYLSNFVPLWTISYNYENKIKNQLDLKVLSYIQKTGLDRFPGGIPASLDNSMLQWDFPNAWPPLQSFLILGLENMKTQNTSKLAFKLASFWLKSNYEGFKNYGKMFEKYYSLGVGQSGSGGEYKSQNGFGWTNGVVLELLNKWGQEVRSTPF